jgi:ribosome-associated translation inhibitor RaiA
VLGIWQEVVSVNLDIQTEHARMRPEWHRSIDDWIERCKALHPEVEGLDVVLHHADGPIDDSVSITATARGRRLRGAARAPTMAAALGEALATVERELSASAPVRATRAA